MSGESETHLVGEDTLLLFLWLSRPISTSDMDVCSPRESNDCILQSGHAAAACLFHSACNIVMVIRLVVAAVEC